MKVKNREYNMFSIEGSAIREECEFEPVTDYSGEVDKGCQKPKKPQS